MLKKFFFDTSKLFQSTKINLSNSENYKNKSRIEAINHRYFES